MGIMRLSDIITHVSIASLYLSLKTNELVVSETFFESLSSFRGGAIGYFDSVCNRFVQFAVIVCSHLAIFIS